MVKTSPSPKTNEKITTSFTRPAQGETVPASTNISNREAGAIDRYRPPSQINPALPDDRGSDASLSLQRFNSIYPLIALPDNITQKEIATIAARLHELAPAVRAHIRGIRFSNPGDPIPNAGRTFQDEAGHVDVRARIIYLRKDAPDFLSAGIFQHEAMHLFVYQQGLEDMNRMLTAIGKEDVSTSTEVNRIKDQSFDTQWKNAIALVNGAEFGRDVEKKSATGLATHWKTKDAYGADEGPRYGFVESYGSQSLDEDAATHVQMIRDNPVLYRQLLDISSEFYARHPDQRIYAQVYRAKFDDLYEHGAITEEKYLELLPASA